jgi:hypothetical protein
VDNPNAATPETVAKEAERYAMGGRVGASEQQADHIMQFFGYAHLPESLADVSKKFAELADAIVATVPRNPERTVALRKILEAKDAAVRACVAR